MYDRSCQCGIVMALRSPSVTSLGPWYRQPRGLCSRARRVQSRLAAVPAPADRFRAKPSRSPPDRQWRPQPVSLGSAGAASHCTSGAPDLPVGRASVIGRPAVARYVQARQLPAVTDSSGDCTARSAYLLSVGGRSFVGRVFR